jgi:hypothetical protein
MATSANFKDLESAERAHLRVQGEIDAVRADDLATMNVELVSAASIVLGCAERILVHRDRMAQLVEFNVKHVDHLVDYALSAWYLYVTNLPEAEPGDAEQLLSEVAALRAKLLMWSAPLVGSGLLEQGAIDRVKEGAGHKDAASDLVALVGLYRSRWDSVKQVCGVTEEDLARGAVIGPAAFALISRRENKASPTQSDTTLRVRRAWTLLDRAYAQCRRALQFLLFDEEAVARIAPNLRRNAGRTSSSTQPEPVTPAEPAAPVTPSTPPIGGTGGPFAPAPTNSGAR